MASTAMRPAPTRWRPRTFCPAPGTSSELRKAPFGVIGEWTESAARSEMVDASCARIPTGTPARIIIITKECRSFTRGRVMRKSGLVAWRECMGIEPTQPTVRQVACGFEDRDGHQAASTPLLHDHQAVGPGRSDVSDSRCAGHGGKIGGETIGRDRDEQAT